VSGFTGLNSATLTLTATMTHADGTTGTYTAELGTTKSDANWEPGTSYNFAATWKDPINLSATATANSYIISEANTKYSFDATKRGNGVVATSAFPTIDKDIATNNSYTASVLWSMGGTGATADGVVKSVEYKDGKISFTSTNTTTGGNAVIALKDASDNILWSWHIWMNAAFNAANDQEYTTAYYGGSVKMMPYNLGAVNTTNTAIADKPYNDGLLYQWGRKDPFLGGGDYSSETAEPSASDYYAATAFSYGATGGSVNAAYQNPTTFYQGGTGYDWSDVQYDNLWGNGRNGSDTYADWGEEITTLSHNKKFPTKTLFDPCPPGYVVAPRNTWNSGTFSNFANKGRTYQYGSTTATGFYSASGRRSRENGTLNAVGTFGYYWSSSPSESGYRLGGVMNFNSGNVTPLSSGGRSYGFSVRCARME
jgi:hypothetical protein